MTQGTVVNRAGLLLIAALIFATSVSAPVVGQEIFPADDDLQLMLDYLVADGATPAIVLGIVDGHGATRVLGAGSGGSRSVGARTVFEVGSINKTFTGTLLALAVRRGEVALDDPVADYLPDSVTVPRQGDREITLLDLATHRSGLPGLPTNYLPGDLGDPYAAYTLDVLYDFLSSYELTREPGTHTEYSNLGFGLLGHALARAAGTTYTALLRERILDPLGMNDTGYEQGAEAAERTAVPHSRGEEVPLWTGTEAIRGAGGLRSTMADMLRYLEANLGPPESELERAMRDAHETRAPFDVQGVDATRIGLAWQKIPLDSSGDRVIITHGGNTAGSSARIAFDPERGVGFVRLTNVGAFPDDIGLYLLRTGPPIDDPVVDVPVEALRRYVGAYRFAPGANLYIRLDDRGGWLTSQLGRTVEFRLYPDSDTSAYLRRIHARFAFRVDDAGEVEAAVLNPGPRERVLPKVADETPSPRFPTPEILDRPLTREEVARYAGTYDLGGAARTVEVRVRGEGGQLVAELGNGAFARLRYQGDHTFIPFRDPASRVTFEVSDGRAVALTMDLHGSALTGRRR